MARPTEHDELISAWRALGGIALGDEGWRTIPLGSSVQHRLRAGRHFPGNEEALLVGFGLVQVPAALLLPQARGFVVLEVDLGPDFNGRKWIALCRRPEGSLDMFAMMAIDIIANLNITTSEEGLFQILLARIRAWQEFMRRGTETRLSPDAEVGLYGELLFLRSILTAGTSQSVAVEGWVGPLNGTQDFALGHGAVEVKTTIAAEGFSADIGSLEQLDDAQKQPLFLAAERIRLDESGLTLSALIDQMRSLLVADSVSLSGFNIKLLHSGFLDAAAEHYKRKFLPVSERLFLVDSAFPKLTRALVRPEIRKARYELDVDRVNVQPMELHAALNQLGVI